MSQRKRKQGQTWSLDLIIGVVVLMLVIVILYSILSTEQDEEQALRREADIIYARLETETTDIGTTNLTVGHSIDRMRLEDIYNMSYNELKSLLGIRGDFCIVIVDDDNRIIPVEQEGTYLLSTGRPDHKLIITMKDGSAVYCGQTVTDI